MAALDLHIHSCHSLDGEYPPEALVAMAHRAGIAAMAIADHNSTAGVEPAAAAAGAAGIASIPAIEIDCIHDGLELHLLGYFIDPSDPAYAALHREVTAMEQNAAALRIRMVQDLGIHLNGDELVRSAPDGVISCESIAEAALADERNGDCALLAPYRPGGYRDDNPLVNFYWDYCARGKPAFAEMPYMSLADAVRLVRRTGGVPVIAHPAVNLDGHEDILPAILAHGIEGIEAYCSYHGPEQAARWDRKATENGLVATCGSDFHGAIKPAVTLGGHGGDRLGMEVVETLAARRL